MVDADAGNECRDILVLPVKVGDMRAAGLKLIGRAVMSLEGSKSEQLEQLKSLTRLLLDSESNELRRQRLDLEERWFEFEATAASTKELPQMRAYLAAIGNNEKLSHEEKMKRVHAILFGWRHQGTGGSENPSGATEPPGPADSDAAAQAPEPALEGK